MGQRSASRVVWEVVAVAVAWWFSAVCVPIPAAAQDAVFDAGFINLRGALFSGIANQIGNLPVPTGGGFAYQLDPSLGVITRKTESFGPVFADRYETTGKGKLTLNASYTRHTFDVVDGAELRTGEIGGQFFPTFGARNFAIGVQFRESVDVDVFTLGGSYGITDRIDVGVVIPILRVNVKERATIVSSSSCPPGSNPATGAGCQTIPLPQPLPFTPLEAESTGIGDVIFRGKYNFLELPDVKGGRFGLAASLDVKVPTGDEGDRAGFTDNSIFLNPVNDPFIARATIGDPPLGTGIVRVKPQLIASGSWFNVSPHVNVGFELGTTEGITNDFVAAVGLDYTPFGWVTFAGDVLVRHAFNVERLRVSTSGTGGTGGLADPDTFTLSLGAKFNPISTLLVFVNVLVPLNNTGVRDDVTPTIGLEWSF